MGSFRRNHLAAALGPGAVSLLLIWLIFLAPFPARAAGPADHQAANRRWQERTERLLEATKWRAGKKIKTTAYLYTGSLLDYATLHKDAGLAISGSSGDGHHVGETKQQVNFGVDVGNKLLKALEQGLRKTFEKVERMPGHLPGRLDDQIRVYCYPLFTDDLIQASKSKAKHRTAVVKFHLVVALPGREEYATVSFEGSGEMHIDRGLPTIKTIDNTAKYLARRMQRVYQRCVDEALDGLDKKIEQQLRKVAMLHDFDEGLLLEQTGASELDLVVSFSDARSILPNNRLDACEEALILIHGKNEGKGIAFDVKAEVKCDNGRVSLARRTEMGDIAPGKSIAVEIPVTTDCEVRNGFASISVQLKEKRGHHSTQHQLDIETVALATPVLEFDAVTLNDGERGRARGNNNGIVERGETIELEARVRNSGQGPALGTTIRLEGLPEEFRTEESTSQLGRIEAGAIGAASVVFQVPRATTRERLTGELIITDVRGIEQAERPITYSLALNSPRVVVAIDPPGEMHNGDEVELTLSLDNRGKMTARDVRLELRAPAGVTLQPGSFDVGDVEPRDQPRRYTLTCEITRIYDREDIPLEAVIQQADFDEESTEFALPLILVAPDLRAELRFLNADGQALVPGSRVEAQWILHNDGELEARDLQVTVSEDAAGIRAGETFSVGTLRPHGSSRPYRLDFDVPRAVAGATFSFQARLEQRDFAAVTREVPCAVGEDAVVVAKVEGQDLPQLDTGGGRQVRSAPVLQIIEPGDGAELSGRRTTLQAAISDESRLTRVEAFCGRERIYDSDGNELAQEQLRRTGGRSLHLQKAISSLEPGSHRLLVRAVDDDNMTGEIAVTVFVPSGRATVALPRPSDVDRDYPASEAKNEHSVALLIGIEQYQEIPDADFADRDALALGHLCVESLNFSAENVVCLTNDEASYAVIRKELSKLDRRSRPDGDLLFFYSGHGTAAGEGQRAYIVPHDGDANYPEDTCLELDRIYERLGRCEARRKLVIVDACFSGLDRRNKPILKGERPVRIVAESTIASDLWVVSSASGAQPSSSLDRVRHGIFSYYLLKGLRGAADGNGDSRIAADELVDYLTREVRREAGGLDREQDVRAAGVRLDGPLVEY